MLYDVPALTALLNKPCGAVGRKVEARAASSEMLVVTTRCYLSVGTVRYGTVRYIIFAGVFKEIKLYLNGFWCYV